jgi:hypothetical protein
LQVCRTTAEGKDLGRSIITHSGGPVNTRTLAVLALVLVIIVILALWVF